MPEREANGPDEARAVDAVDAYWDALIDGPNGDAAPPPAVDPELEEAVRLLHAQPAPRPDAAFVARLEKELLMDIHATAVGPQPAAISAGPAPNGRWTLRPAASARPARRRVWSRALETVAAAALLLAILGGLVASWGLRPERAERARTGAPGTTQATPPMGTDDGAVMFLGNAGRTGEEPGPGPTGEPEMLWRVPIPKGQGGHVWSTPRVVGGIAYLAGSVLGDAEERQTEAGVVLALDAASGAERWRAEVMALPPVDPGTVASVWVGEPAVEDGGLFVDVTVDRWRERRERDAPVEGAIEEEEEVESETSSTLVALDAATGTERWRVATGETYGLSPAVADGVVFSGGGEGVLLALDAATGDERWRAAAGAATLEPGGDRWLGRPAVGDGAVYVSDLADNASTLVAFDVATGAERWRFAPQGESEGVTEPVVADGLVYVGSHPLGDGRRDPVLGRLRALDAATGQERWSYETASEYVESPLVGGRLVYVMERSGEEAELVSLDAASGHERWSFVPEGHIDSRPVLAGGELLFTTRTDGNGLTGLIGDLLGIEDDAFLYAVDAASGEERWRTEVEPANGAGPFGVAGGVIYRIEGLEEDGGAGTLAAYGDR